MTHPRFATGSAAAALLGLLALARPAAGAAQPPTAPLSVAGATLRIEADPGQFRGGAVPIRAWIQRSAEIVAHYYGRFPTSSVVVRIVSVAGDVNPFRTLRVLWGIVTSVRGTRLEAGHGRNSILIRVV